MAIFVLGLFFGFLIGCALERKLTIRSINRTFDEANIFGCRFLKESKIKGGGIKPSDGSPRPNVVVIAHIPRRVEICGWQPMNPTPLDPLKCKAPKE